VGEVAVSLGEGGHAGAVEEVVGVGVGVGYTDEDGEGGGTGGGDGGLRGGLGLCRSLRVRGSLRRCLHRVFRKTGFRGAGLGHVGICGSVENL
jgi:hypothetical protein